MRQRILHVTAISRPIESRPFAFPSLAAARLSEKPWPESEMAAPVSERHLAPRAMAA